MSSSGIGQLGSVQAILSSAFQKVGLASGAGTSTTGSQPSDNAQLSPLGQVLGTLQQLQQSNPGEYKHVTQQLAATLQTAAQAAQSAGNTNAANQLSQLSSDFTNASTTGLLPNIQDLAQATSTGNVTGGSGHHHHHAHATPAASGTVSGIASSSASTQSDATDPLTIIQNALANS